MAGTAQTGMAIAIDIDALVTDAVVEEYWERGYWISPRLFDDEHIARLRHAQKRLWQGDNDHEIASICGFERVDPTALKVRQQINGYWLNDEIRAVLTGPLLGGIGARLMNVETVQLWHDQVLYKPGAGRDGAQVTAGNIGWHQDYGHWRACSTDNMCTAWIALQDTDLTNGGMRTIVKSHRWGLLEGSNTFGSTDLDGLAATFGREHAGEWLDEPCIMKAGQVSFHHALTLHGSGPNLTDEPRLALVAHMMSGDTVYRAGRQWHPNLTFLGPDAVDGQRFPERYFPRMWPPEGR
jgi:ectoine hydroxylase-related dioxygenase (phytanoyl-CoA dioxygenase family)